LILITGRRLDDLKTVFSGLHLFDVIVAENGATIFNPQTNTEEALCAAPPANFLARLRQCKVPFSVGRRVVASVRPHDTSIVRVIQELQMDLKVILNRESVMVLPSGIDKASGLLAALQKTGFDPSVVVGFGDAENDLSFLKLCGMSVAVANAIEPLKEEVDVVATWNDGTGVAEIIERLIAEKSFRG
jgi:hydroxymethylpyrimidine pyrophosphatase-like HAD family hydrolase